MSSSVPLVEDLVVLHAARVRGVVGMDVGRAVGSERVVMELVDAGLLRVGRRGVVLTAAGLRRHGELLGTYRAASDVVTVAATYERFLALNAPVKAACSRWQQSDRDAEALFEVTDELGGYLERLGPVLAKAAEVVRWFDQYGVRLGDAWRRAMEGDNRFVTDPQVASFHCVWFECHEDYLVTLGRSREEEEA